MSSLNPTIKTKLTQLLDFSKMEHNTIQEVQKEVKEHYKSQNYKSLSFTINELLPLQKNGQYIFDLGHYTPYIKLIDKNLSATEDCNLDIVDPDCKFLKEQDKQRAYKYYSKVKYLEYFNQHKESVFITFTCPSEFHFYSQRGKNKKCDYATLGQSIEESFKFQKKINRVFYKELKKYLKRKKLSVDTDYIRMLEHHNKDKNLTIHSHSIHYVDADQLKVLKQVYNLIVKRFKLKQTKLEILTHAQSSSYVMKYILKNFSSNPNDNFFNEFKRYYNKHRFFTCSNFKHTKQAVIDKTYTHLKNDRPRLFQKFQNSSVPLYVNLEKYIIKHFSITYTNKKLEQVDYSMVKEHIEEYIDTHTHIDKASASKIDFKLYSKDLYNELTIDINLISLLNLKQHTITTIQKIEYIQPLPKINQTVWEYQKVYKPPRHNNILKARGFR